MIDSPDPGPDRDPQSTDIPPDRIQAVIDRLRAANVPEGLLAEVWLLLDDTQITVCTDIDEVGGLRKEMGALRCVVPVWICFHGRRSMPGG